jgi:hypothetical protein
MSTTEQSASPESNPSPADVAAHKANGSTPIDAGTDANHPVIPITKPASGSLDRFKSKRGNMGSGVETLRAALPHHKLPDAKDFVRLHPDEENWWSDELCFVNVPVKGQKRDLLHLVDEDLVPPDVLPQVQRFRLALASKPHDIFFLCHVPTRNLDNSYNADNLKACEMAKTRFVKAVSDRENGNEGYVLHPCRDADAFPNPKWPSQTLDDLITLTFGSGRTIDREDHPALLRLVGIKQSVS